MGVPKFFRYTCERYPCILETVQDYQISDFDNLYLDMNGIFHMCSHPSDDPHYRVTEEEIFMNIFHYTNYIFQLVRPQKVFYIAVDGVAPRAKMNHQRARRFCSIRSKREAEAKAREAGEVLPTTEAFDSNCISTGTVFMAKLHEQMKHFIKHKISTDNSWASCRVIYSSHQTPGEGEHKIMDYVRYVRTLPDHDPNTRHCIYGQDADLIMLTLCTHEPNFAILREEVIFGRNNNNQSSSPDLKHYNILHISLLRNYLDLEFSELKESLPFEYDLDKIIDDWVFMSFLVGNDFIPHLPQLHINTNALPILYDIYKRVLPQLDGYMNEGGILNLPRFEVFLKQLAVAEKDEFRNTLADLSHFEGKAGMKSNHKNAAVDDNETFNVTVDKLDDDLMSQQNDDLMKLIRETNEMFLDKNAGLDDENSGAEDEDDLFDAEFLLHKKDYYITKLEYPEVTEEVLKAQTEHYIRALQWILHYYFQGCSSWSWYYPHHYAPFISDISDFGDFNISFKLDTPLKPFEQLLAILPAGSKNLIPKTFQHLMTSKSSPIIDFYPETFETDLNGKKNDWEAVVLIPFINSDSLLEAMKPYNDNLTEEEKKRNTHGPISIYEYTVENLGEVEAPEYFTKIKHCHARETQLQYLSFTLPPDKIIRSQLPNPFKNIYYPGFPTLNNIKFTAKFEKVKIKVFNYAVTSEHAILSLDHEATDEPPLENIAEKLLGKIVWVGWPHVVKAKVVAVSNMKYKYTYTMDEKNDSLEDDEILCIKKSENIAAPWNSEVAQILEHFMYRMGVDTGDVNTIVHAVHLKGYKVCTPNTNNHIVLSAEWYDRPVPYAYQTVLPELDCAPVDNFTKYKKISDLYAKGDKVFIIFGPHYGSLSEIVETSSSGRIMINTYLEDEPTLKSFKLNFNYLPAKTIAAKCGISDLLLAKITGLLFISLPKTDSSTKSTYRKNIGLCLRLIKQNEAVAGYTKHFSNKWLYSPKCVDLIISYIEQFRGMFDRLAMVIKKDDITDKDIFPNEEDSAGKVAEVLRWIDEQPFKKSVIRSNNSYYLEPEEIIFINDMIEKQKNGIESSKKMLRLQVRPSILYKPYLSTGNLPPDSAISSYNMYDRVVCVNPKLTVPLGLKGTIISICNSKPVVGSINLSNTLNVEPIYDVLFDEPFLGGMDMENLKSKCYKLSAASLLNLTVGRKLHQSINTKTFIERKQTDSVKSTQIKHDSNNSAFAYYNSDPKSKTWRSDFPPLNTPPSLKNPATTATTVASKPAPVVVPKPVPEIYSKSASAIVPSFAKKLNDATKKVETEVDYSTQFLRSMLKINDETPSYQSTISSNNKHDDSISKKEQSDVPVKINSPHSQPFTKIDHSVKNFIENSSTGVIVQNIGNTAQPSHNAVKQSVTIPPNIRNIYLETKNILQNIDNIPLQSGNVPPPPGNLPLPVNILKQSKNNPLYSGNTPLQLSNVSQQPRNIPTGNTPPQSGNISSFPGNVPSHPGNIFSNYGNNAPHQGNVFPNFGNNISHSGNVPLGNLFSNFGNNNSYPVNTSPHLGNLLSNFINNPSHSANVPSHAVNIPSNSGNMYPNFGNIPSLPGNVPPHPRNVYPNHINSPSHAGNILPHSGNIPPHPGNVQSHPVNVQSHPGNVPPHAGNVQSHPVNVQSHPGNTQLHPGNVPPHAGNVPSQPRNVQSHPGNIQSHPGNVPSHPGNLFSNQMNNPLHAGNMQSHPGNVYTNQMNNPSHAGNLPLLTGNIPSHPINVPQQQGNVYSNFINNPSHTGNIRPHSGNISSHPGNLPPHPGNVFPNFGSSPSHSRNANPHSGTIFSNFGNNPAKPGNVLPHPGSVFPNFGNSPSHPGNVPPHPGNMFPNYGNNATQHNPINITLQTVNNTPFAGNVSQHPGNTTKNPDNISHDSRSVFPTEGGDMPILHSNISDSYFPKFLQDSSSGTQNQSSQMLQMHLQNIIEKGKQLSETSNIKNDSQIQPLTKPPNLNQLPIPEFMLKDIEMENSINTKGENLDDTVSSYAEISVPTPFVPLQAVSRQRKISKNEEILGKNDKRYIPVNKNNLNSANSSSENTAQYPVKQTQQNATIPSKASKVKTNSKKPKASRLAANFKIEAEN